MCPVIFIEIWGHWMTTLSLMRSGGRSRRHLDVLPADFPLFGGKKSHQFLILSENFCRSSAVPVIGGAGSSGGVLFTLFAWCWNSAERRITISSTIFDRLYPDFLRLISPVSASYRWASQKWVLNEIHVFWIGGRRFQDLMDSRKFSVLLRMLYALEIAWGCE